MQLYGCKGRGFGPACLEGISIRGWACLDPSEGLINQEGTSLTGAPKHVLINVSLVPCTPCKQKVQIAIHDTQTVLTMGQSTGSTCAPLGAYMLPKPIAIFLYFTLCQHTRDIPQDFQDQLSTFLQVEAIRPERFKAWEDDQADEVIAATATYCDEIGLNSGYTRDLLSAMKQVRSGGCADHKHFSKLHRM